MDTIFLHIHHYGNYCVSVTSINVKTSITASQSYPFLSTWIPKCLQPRISDYSITIAMDTNMDNHHQISLEIYILKSVIMSPMLSHPSHHVFYVINVAMSPCHAYLTVACAPCVCLSVSVCGWVEALSHGLSHPPALPPTAGYLWLGHAVQACINGPHPDFWNHHFSFCNFTYNIFSTPLVSLWFSNLTIKKSTFLHTWYYL